MPETQLILTVPLPPPALRSNNRSHWSAKKKAADEYSQAVFFCWGASSDLAWNRKGLPWEEADVTYVWRYAGVAPDADNIAGNCKALQDILCVAPKLGMAQALKYKRFHCGILENDRGFRPTYRAEKVAHKRDQCVTVTITKGR